MNSPAEKEYGSTVIINHRVRHGEQADYDQWLKEIAPICQASPGHLDWQIIRPIPGLTEGYTVIIRFDTHAHLRQWMDSSDRRRLIEQARPLLALDDAYTIHSGLDFLFSPAGAGARVPVRWKQFLVTWSAIYPLALGMPLVTLPLLQALGCPDSRFFTGLFVSAGVVFLMIYVVMPRYTKLVRKWLFS